MSENIKIIWLEDEPETISVIKHILESKYTCKIKICESFTSFSDEVEEFEDRVNHVIIIDIRMIFTREIKFTCFGKSKKIIASLDSGFEYFNHCIKNQFSQVKIVFFSSKPKEEAEFDAKKHNIDIDSIISKESTTDLIDLIKDIK